MSNLQDLKFYQITGFLPPVIGSNDTSGKTTLDDGVLSADVTDDVLASNSSADVGVDQEVVEAAEEDEEGDAVDDQKRKSYGN